MLDVAAAYERYAPHLRSYIASRVGDLHAADDLLSEVFVEVCGRAGSYQERGLLRAWLYRIARSRIGDHHRAQARRPTVPLEERQDRPGEGLEDAALNRALCANLLERANLTQGQQRVIWLRFGVGLTPMQIARATGQRAGAVKQLQYRALGNLARAAGVARVGRA